MGEKKHPLEEALELLWYLHEHHDWRPSRAEADAIKTIGKMLLKSVADETGIPESELERNPEAYAAFLNTDIDKLETH